MILETIYKCLFENEKFHNTVYPYLRPELFDNREFKTIFEKMLEYTNTYSKKPIYSDIELMLSTDNDLSEEDTQFCFDKLKKIKELDMSSNIELLIDETEKWVKNREMELAILASVDILQENKPRGQIEDLIKKALAVNFKVEVGIEYFKDAPKQYEYYTQDDETYKIDIRALNEATGGGFRKKHMYLFIGKVNIGKTIWMCHLAASLMMAGHNVVYVTAEMSENSITHRIDANILDMETKEFNKTLDRKKYYALVRKVVQKKGHGQLFIKEYPTGYGSKTQIINYLNELRLKKGFKPQILIADYLNIFASARLPMSLYGDSYTYMKAVAEEFRSIAVERDIVVITPTQLNRDSADKSVDNVDMTGQSDSWGIPAIADFMGVILQPKEMYDSGQYLFKVIKTRFDENVHKVYNIGVERKKMRLTNLEDDVAVPITVQERMSVADKKRESLSLENDDKVFVFNEEMD